MFKRDYIDLFRVVLGGNWEDSEGRLDALAKAKAQGKIRAIGGAVHRPEHLLQGLHRYPDVLEYVMVPASFYAPLLIREDRDVARTIRTHHTGVIAMKPMGAERQNSGYIFKLEPKGRVIEALRGKGLQLGKLAIKYLLQSDLVSSVIPTMNSVEEVLENVGASGDGELTEEERTFLQLYREEGDRVFPHILPDNDYWITPWKV
jgi:aryl-alcohol dehydrogenase-like predicted oxidoreductase